MSARAVVLAVIVSAALGALITAAAFRFGVDRDPSSAAAFDTAAVNIAAAHVETAQPARPAPLLETEDELEDDFVRSAVDWSAVFAHAAPALVTVATNVGAGSGFFVSEAGHAITNLHVVVGASQIRVFLADGRSFEAELIASDAGNDLALLQIDADDLELSLPSFASVDELRVGDPVGALGAPYSLPNTLTVGIVSALDRTRPSGGATHEPLRDLIQTDAALNPGNSGGMLVDARGRVIGIPTQIESPDRVSSGVGFAVASDTLLRVLPTLMKGEDVERTFLGVQLSTATGELVISNVACGSAADRAGLRDGDALLRINGEATRDFDDMLAMLSRIAPGDDFTITVERRGRTLTLDATARGWPEAPPFYGCG